MELKADSFLQGGKYRILRVLGQGGFGITYLAENTLLETAVAVKEFFPKEYCGRDNTSHLTLGTQNNAEKVDRLKARFLKEAKNIAKLNHPGIVKIHDVFEENSTAYYVMDYIEGESLSQMVKNRGRLSEAEAVGYITKVGEALEYIHSRQMTHFDVKPANIMVRRSDNSPILIDFGLSKQYDAKGDATSTLIQGVSQGFSPIELYNMGEIATFSPQSDVYSLAATLFYLLTATVPPSASQIIQQGIQFPDNISPGIREAISRAIATRKSDRPASVTALLGLLNRNAKHKSTVRSKLNTTRIESTIKREDTQTIIGAGVPPIPPTTSLHTNKPTQSNGIIWRSIGWVIAIFLIIGIFLLVSLSKGNSDNISYKDNSSRFFTEYNQLNTGDYYYDNGKFSHTKIYGEKPIARVISTSYYPTLISLICVGNCTMDEIETYVQRFSQNHNNVKVPSLKDWEFISEKVYHLIREDESDGQECPFMGDLYDGTHSHSLTRFYKERTSSGGWKYSSDMWSEFQGHTTGTVWCSDVNYYYSRKEGKNLKHQKIFTLDFGNQEGCTKDPNKTANLFLMYTL